jgi:hypothetical protein
VLRCISVVRVWSVTTCLGCVRVHVCVCVCVLQEEVGVCVLQTKSPLRVVSTSPKAQCRERRRARRRSCGYASSPSPRRCMTASRPSVARTRTGPPCPGAQRGTARAAPPMWPSPAPLGVVRSQRVEEQVVVVPLSAPPSPGRAAGAARGRSPCFGGGAVAASSSPHKRAARPLARAAPKSGQHPMQRPFARRGHSGRRVHHLLT